MSGRRAEKSKQERDRIAAICRNLDQAVSTIAF